MSITSARPVRRGGDRTGQAASGDSRRDRNRYSDATLVLAHVAVIAAGLGVRVSVGITPALVAAVLLSPVLLQAARRYRWAVPLLALTPFVVVSGWVLSELTSVTHRVDMNNAAGSVLLLAGGMASMALLLWARTVLALPRVVALYGLAALVGTAAQGETLWKYHLAIPATLVVLGLLERRGGRLLPALAVLVMGGISVLSDGRSLFAFSVLAATLTLFQSRDQLQTHDRSPAASRADPRRSGPPLDPGSGSRAERIAAAGRTASEQRRYRRGGRDASDAPRTKRWVPAVVLIGVAVAGYYMVTALLTSGALGEEVEQRTEAQIEASGSVIAGGRPEFAATRELLRLRPAGYGIGVVPDWSDLDAGRSGLASINVEAGGYASNYMFGGQFRLHSVLADLWVSYGWVGVGFGVVVLLALLSSLSTLLAERRATTSVIFLVTLSIWFVFFGPIFSNWDEICAALGFALVPIGAAVTGGGRPSGAEGHSPVGEDLPARPR